MAILRIDIAGNPKTIPFRTVLQVGANSIGMLDDLDHAFSHEPLGATEWLMHDTSMNGRLRVELHSRVRQLKKKMLPDVGRSVAQSFVTGLKVIEYEGVTPPFLSEYGLRHASRMTRVIGQEGANRLIASVPEEANEAEVTRKSAENIAKLMQAPYTSLGSIEGHLEGINLHAQPRFIVYEARTKKAVTCLFGPFRNELMDKIKDSLEHRVSVSGRLYRNAKGEPVRIRLFSPSDLKVFGVDLKVMPFRALGGSDRDFTGGESSHEYIRRMRG
jgi:hypothetical protein